MVLAIDILTWYRAATNVAPGLGGPFRQGFGRTAATWASWTEYWTQISD